jgi:hypothetical protein
VEDPDRDRERVRARGRRPNAEEVRLQEETEEAKEQFGPIEDAVEDPADD